MIGKVFLFIHFFLLLLMAANGAAIRILKSMLAFPHRLGAEAIEQPPKRE
jgi:hypothetical protein